MTSNTVATIDLTNVTTSNAQTVMSGEKASVSALLNANGTSASDGTTYHIAATTGWDAGANTSASLGITVSGASPPPVLRPPTRRAPRSATTRPRQSPLTGSDPDSPALALTYAVATGPAHGTLSGFNATTGAVTYTPTAGYQGADSFTFTDSNGTNTSSAATVSLTVAAGTPTASAQSDAVGHNTAKAVTLTGSDPDSPALALTYTVATGPVHGTLSGSGANLTYTPTAGYQGADSFTFTDSNGANTSSAATVSLTVAAGTPTANAQSDAVGFNTAKAVTLTGSDPDSPALALTYAVATGPAHGTLSGFNASTGAVTYTPTAGYNGPDSFTFTDNNGAHTSSAATVSLTVAADVAPTISGTGASSTSDRATDSLFSGVTVVDSDLGQTETATISFAAADGTLAGAGAPTIANGIATYVLGAAPMGQASSGLAITAALRAVSFTPTATAPNPLPTQTTVTLSVSDGTTSTGADTATVVTATHTTNTPVQTANANPAQTATDKATAQPFAGVTVTDPDTGQTETASIAYAAANGRLAGAGLMGSAGAYTISAGSAAALQAALQALVFTPTMNQVAPGATVQTVFGVSIGDGASTAQTSDTLTVASVNDAPTFGGFQGSAVLPPSGSVVLQPTVTVTDPDVGAQVTSAQVQITSGFAIGDILKATPSTGVTAAYNGQTGVLTLSGAASDAAYAQTLQTVSFSHNGSVDPGSRTVTFTLTDDQGSPASAAEMVSVGGYTQPTTGGGGGGSGSVQTNLDAQQAFPTQTSNLTRAPSNDPALLTPTSSLYAQAQAEKGIAAQLDSGQLSLADAQNALYHLVDGSTSVAEITYAYFTGKTPTQAGLNYLVHSDANATDLNDPYYQQFTTENRYINFANNLATGQGAGAAAFQANYGSLSLTDATAKAYAAVFGVTPTADKIAVILTTQVSNGLGGAETRAQYLADITGGSAISQKAAVVGFLLADSVKEGFGLYQQADLHFLTDLAHGTAVFNVDLLAAYGTAPTLVGQPVTDPTLGG